MKTFTEYVQWREGHGSIDEGITDWPGQAWNYVKNAFGNKAQPQQGGNEYQDARVKEYKNALQRFYKSVGISNLSQSIANNTEMRRLATDNPEYFTKTVYPALGMAINNARQLGFEKAVTELNGKGQEIKDLLDDTKQLAYQMKITKQWQDRANEPERRVASNLGKDPELSQAERNSYLNKAIRHGVDDSEIIRTLMKPETGVNPDTENPYEWVPIKTVGAARNMIRIARQKQALS